MEMPTDLGQAHLRIAHLSADLATVVKFYRDGLGLEVLYEFRDHDGFDAVMLGCKGAGYHLAFVHKQGHKTGRRHRPTTTCWCSTCPTPTNGSVPWRGWRNWAISR